MVTPRERQSRVLTAAEQARLADERAWLIRLQALLARTEAPDEEQATLSRSIARLDHFFLLVIVGEFNAGKSAVINALMGTAILEEGVTPTTTRIQLLTYGVDVTRTAQDGMDLVTAPVPLLQDLSLVDTPGTNAIHREHEAITTEFVPQADLVLFVTSADRPFTESERRFLEGIREWGKKVVFVINKIDILESAAEVSRVERFVGDAARALLGIDPLIVPVSARAALRAQAADGPLDRPAGDRFDALETFVRQTLDERERVRLKLASPIGVADRLARSLAERLAGRRTLLADDTGAVEDIEAQLGRYVADLHRDVRLRLRDLDGVLADFERRGDRFFDETIRIGRVFDLLNTTRLRVEFEREVVADLPRDIEGRVLETIDWLVSSDLAEWQAIAARIQARQTRHGDRMVGQVGARFDQDRARLIETVGRAAREAVDTYDHGREAREMAATMRNAVAGAALTEAGAVGLGAAVAAVATTTVVDVTGLLAAGTIAVVGFFVIPFRRERARRGLRTRMTALGEELTSRLGGQLVQEIERSRHRMLEALAPYTRFVRAEQERLARHEAELGEIRGALAGFARDV